MIATPCEGQDFSEVTGAFGAQFETLRGPEFQRVGVQQSGPFQLSHDGGEGQNRDSQNHW